MFDHSEITPALGAIKAFRHLPQIEAAVPGTGLAIIFGDGDHHITVCGVIVTNSSTLGGMGDAVPECAG